jgi:Spy/CpxP family protein refolding chaperone
MKTSRFLSVFLAPAVLIAAPLASLAQQTNESAPRAQRPMGIMQAPGVNGFALGGPVGVLTDQQRASYEMALGKERGVMMDLQAKLRAARQDFTDASMDQKFDERALREKAVAAARIEAEMAVLRAKAMSEVQPPLTPEQIQKIKTGQPGPIRPMRQPMQRSFEQAPAAAGTNQDANGLPPKK